MGCLRVILCVLLPPLAVLDFGCGSVAIVFLLTLCGWVPGCLAALVICLMQRPVANTTAYFAPDGTRLLMQPMTPRAVKPLGIAGAVAAAFLGVFVISGAVKVYRHADAVRSAPSASQVPSETPATTPDVTAQARYAEHVDWITHKLPASVKDSQARALAKYPALSQPGSTLSEAFVAFYRDAYRRQEPIVYLHTWPESIADECFAQLHASTLRPKVTPSDVDDQAATADTPSVFAPAPAQDVHAGQVWVNGYQRKDGTYVTGHWRSR